MKAKKARKRLREVDGLLAAVMDGYSTDATGVHELLDTAKKAVASAMNSLEEPAAKKPPAPPGAPRGHRRLSAAGRKRLSLAAKKRWAIAKSKGIHAVTGRPLHQSA
jgi:hypothetical protein